MKWTDEKPSEPGWYWWKAPDREAALVLVRELEFYANPRSKWAGPIEEPTE